LSAAGHPRFSSVTAEILDGRALARRMRAELRDALRAFGLPVRLVSLELGHNAAAAVYVRGQRRAAEDVGIELIEKHLEPRGADADQAALLDAIAELNADDDVHGVIVQRPLPRHVDARVIQSAIAPGKDVEGMHPQNMGTILYEHPRMIPCTAAAAEILIEGFEQDLRGAEAVVVGHSEIVGKPIAILLLHHLATVTVCHVGTRDLLDHTRRAHVLVVAVGKAGLVTGDMIQPGAIVIDIGINTLPDGRICGDVDFASASEIAGAITPVPGGVGPVTVAVLMRNTLRAAGVPI
jgi:methylenetetrahydrofolate dehydrogenase (NADP+)/methenyltetrahydrofolate cyclohydrolase